MIGKTEEDVGGEKRFFVDTNILAYAFDESEKRKREICANLVRAGFQGESNLYLSNQILGELFVVLTRKVARPLSKEKASTIVRGFIDSPKWSKMNYDHLTVGRALDYLENASISFWDLLLAETMRDAGVSTLYTENIRDFRKIPWINTVNPMISGKGLTKAASKHAAKEATSHGEKEIKETL
jgi:predicted nucleic acid-binding protein